MEDNSVKLRRLIKDVDAVQRFRNILFYQRHVSHSAFFILILLQYPLLFLLSYISSDPQFIIKIVLGVIAAAAIFFTPYIFYVLIKEKKYGWIITFFVMIIIPLLLAYILFRDALFYEAIILIPLASFYFYCYLIKYEVDRWLGEYHSYQERLQQKKARVDRMRSEY